MFFLALTLVPGPAGVALPGNAPCGTSLWRLFSGIHASAHSRKGNPRRTSDLVLGVQTPHHFRSEAIDFAISGKRNQCHGSGLAGLKTNSGAGGHVQSEAAGFGAVEIQSRRSEEHTSELQSRPHLVCRLLLEKKKQNITRSQPQPHI